MNSFFSLSNFNILEKYFLIYLFTINTWTFLIFGLDKYKAMENKYRISEFKLALSTFLGGGIGALMGMILFKHKLSKPLFTIGVPVLTVLESFIFIFICNFLR